MQAAWQACEWVLGDSQGLSQRSKLHPQLLTWPGTSPPLHSAESTGGLSGHRWMLAHSWGLGPNQGDLGVGSGRKGGGRKSVTLRRVRLAMVNAQRPLQHQTPFAILPPLHRPSSPPGSLPPACGVGREPFSLGSGVGSEQELTPGTLCGGSAETSWQSWDMSKSWETVQNVEPEKREGYSW